MFKRLVVLILLAVIGVHLVPAPKTKAASVVEDIDILDVRIQADTTCNSTDFPGWTIIHFHATIHMEGTGDTASIAWLVEHTGRAPWQAGPFHNLPMNTDLNVWTYAPSNELDGLIRVTFFWPDDPTVQAEVLINCNGNYLITPDEEAPAVAVVEEAAFRDGRVNKDPGQHATIYCVENGIDIWYGKKQHFFVSTEQIEAVPAQPTEHTLIASNGAVDVFRLEGGWFQVNLNQTPTPGQTYGVRWDNCPATNWEAFEFYQ